MHPRFEEVDRVVEVIERLGMARVDVREPPAEADYPAVGRILKRRMERDDLDVAIDTVIEGAAVEELQVLGERDRDMRSVLKLAHAAAGHALARGAASIAARDIRGVVARASH